MRSFSREWQSILSSPAPKWILATIDPYGRHPMQGLHPALEPGTLTAATDRDLRNQGAIVVSHAESGRDIMFPPYLGDWPTVSRSVAPLNYRADIASVALKIVANKRFVADLGIATNASIRLDLCSYGVDLADVIPIFAGRTSDKADIDLELGTALIPAIDGNPRAQAMFPEDKVGRDDFPDAPLDVLDRAVIPVIFGQYPERTLCVPISSDYRRYAVQIGDAYQLPTSVERGGVAVAGGYRFVRAVTPTTQTRYLELQFDESPDELIAGSSRLVSVSGGIGIVNTNPIEYLSAIAGIPLDPRTKAMLTSRAKDFEFSSVYSFRALALQLVTTQLAPQIGFAATQDLHRINLVPLGFEDDGPVVRVGSELLFSMSPKWERSSEEMVKNSFEFQCGRDQYGSNGPLWRVLRNRNVPSRVRALQQASFSRFGHRHQDYPAPDLIVERDTNGRVIGCAAGERLGNTYGRLFAFPLLSMPYQARWTMLGAERGDCLRLVDEQYSIDEEPCKVLTVDLPPTGPQLTLAVQQLG